MQLKGSLVMVVKKNSRHEEVVSEALVSSGCFGDCTEALAGGSASLARRESEGERGGWRGHVATVRGTMREKTDGDCPREHFTVAATLPHSAHLASPSTTWPAVDAGKQIAL